MEMNGKVIVVTGGASGIGAAMCRRFAQEGAQGIVVADLDEAQAAAVAREVGGASRRVDVSNEGDLRELVAFATEKYGRVDVFCSNAGVAGRGDIDASNGDWQLAIGVNVLAHVYAARAVLPQMLARGEGYLMQTASAAGLLTQVDSAPYSVTKHAAVGFAEWVAINYGDKGIRVSCLCPQGVKTPMLLGKEMKRQSFLSEDAVTPEFVAEEVVKTMREERFLVLPHPEVLTYIQRKTGDYDRWIKGMRKVRARAAEMRAADEARKG